MKLNFSFFLAFFSALKQVYASSLYWLITIITALIVFTLNVLVHNTQVVFHRLSLPLIFALLYGSYDSMTPFSFSLLMILSLLTGIIVSFTIFLIKRQIHFGVYASTGSFLISLLAPACSSCALGFFGIFGLSGLLFLLPLKGLEFGLLALALVIISLFFLARKITHDSCSFSSFKN